MPIPARAFSIFWAPLLISLSLAGCIVSADYAGPSPEQVLPRLISLLKDPDPEQRRTAAQALGKIAYAKAVPALVEALRDSDPGVRRNAAWALGIIEPDEFDWSPVVALLFDPDPGVREAAGGALSLTGANHAAAEFLQERLRDPGVSNDTKRLGALALGSMAIKSDVGFLIKMLQDRDPRVRRWAVVALGEMADQKTVAPLSRVLTKDPDPGVRIEAAFRLGKFGGEAARPALTAALKDANADVRRLADAALKELVGGGQA
jgi:HEAT repeat protein